MLEEIKNKELIHKKILSLKRNIEKNEIYKPFDVSQFVFLCGANQSNNQISERRKAIIEFSKKNLPHAQFFLAEKIFDVLEDEGSKENILDVENLISKFADFILIILESPSSFTELGAFSHKELRSKLVVINDLKFKDSESFINLGPIKAIQDQTEKERIIYYNMKKDGVTKLDSIGDTFINIYKLFKEPKKSKSDLVDFKSCDPSEYFDKNAAMFIHDLLYISGPILHKELIEILKIIFGNKRFNKVSTLMALLVSFDSIEKNDKGLYRSKLKKTYYEYKFDIEEVISTFRNYLLKKYSERIYEY